MKFPRPSKLSLGDKLTTLTFIRRETVVPSFLMCAIVFLDIGRFSILVYRIIHLALPGILIHYILHKNNTRIRYAWMAVVISHNNTGSLKKHTDQVIIKQTESSHVAYISRFISCARVFWENINCFSLSDFLDNFKLLFSPFFQIIVYTCLLALESSTAYWAYITPEVSLIKLKLLNILSCNVSIYEMGS